MEIVLRSVAVFLNLLGIVLLPILALCAKFEKRKRVPKMENKMFSMSATELADKIRTQELRAIDVIDAFICRVREVRDVVNGVVQDRYAEARKEAERADEICSKMTAEEILMKYPLLGVPFTVKESCSVKGLPLIVGNKARGNVKATEHGEAVEHLINAGAIPLLVSATPEFCFSWETSNLLHGICKNPYNTSRTAGGSSGGEAVLNAVGATVFGVGSDLAGSIRIPCLFNGLFGHKPTGSLVSIEGHFPHTPHPNFSDYLQIGPMTRFAKDLPLLMSIMAGKNAHKLEFEKLIHTKDIKIYYTDFRFTFIHTPITSDISRSMGAAIQHFQRNGVSTKLIDFDMTVVPEITLSTILAVDDLPDLMAQSEDPKKKDNIVMEILKRPFLPPRYSMLALCFALVMESKAFMSAENRAKYVEEGKLLKEKMKKILGDDGVLFFPTFQCPAFYHNTSLLNVGGVPYCTIFNILGFPATHVPMGLNKDGLPIGFQVIAAPYQDKLCFQIAGELEAAFGGWVPPPMEEPKKDD